MNGRILIGSAMIILQLLSYAGSSNSGAQPAPVSIGQFVYDLIFFLFYNATGIIGAILLIWGIIAKHKGN